MKNANDKYVEYARVIEMCKGTKFENEPWKCIRGVNLEYISHPLFGDKIDLEFAVAILEDEPLFVGDKVYWKHDGSAFDWDGGLITVDSWDKHITRKGAFTLNGVELPRPSKTSKVSFGFASDLIGVDLYSDAENVASEIKRILEEAAK